MYGTLYLNGMAIDKEFYSREAIKMLEELGFIFEASEEK